MDNQIDINDTPDDLNVESVDPINTDLPTEPTKKLGKKGLRASRVMDESKLEILRLARIKAVEARRKNAEARKLAAEDPTSNKVPVKALKKQLKESIAKEVQPEEVDVDELLNKKIEKIKLEEERINSIVNQKLMKLQVKENKEIEMPKKKPKKKIVYEDSDSDSEEIIVRRKSKKKVEPVIEQQLPPPPPPPRQPTAQEIQQQQFAEFQNQLHQSVFANRMNSMRRFGR
jgi:hypothetical protein